MLIVGAGVAAVRGGGESASLAGVSIVLYLIGFALLSSRPAGPATEGEVFVDKAVVIVASAVLLLSLALTFWARNAGNAALTQLSSGGINVGGLAVIALIGVYVMRAALRHSRYGKRAG